MTQANSADSVTFYQLSVINYQLKSIKALFTGLISINLTKIHF
jgi:hypothetical protein